MFPTNLLKITQAGLFYYGMASRLQLYGGRFVRTHEESVAVEKAAGAQPLNDELLVV